MTLSTGIERLRIRNYRALRDVTFDQLSPLTVLLGPNGSGKSTVFDALRFLYESFEDNLAAAWQRRGGLAEIRTRGASGQVEVELACRVNGDECEYRLAVDEEDGAPVVVEENLTWRPAGQQAFFTALEFRRGRGTVHYPGGDQPTELASQDLLGVRTFGEIAQNAEIAAFLRFFRQFQLSDVDVNAMRRGSRRQRAVARLTTSGDNVASVVEQFKEQLPETWHHIVRALRRYVPRLQDIQPARSGDGSYLVTLLEADGGERILPEHISDGTLKLLGYLVALQSAGSVLLLEEPENQVNPMLHQLLAEQAGAAASSQVIVATHSPDFVNALRPEEVWMTYRDDDGYTGLQHASELPKLMAMVEAGGLLGSLWTEGYFDVGDPLTRSGRPR